MDTRYHLVSSSRTSSYRQEMLLTIWPLLVSVLSFLSICVLCVTLASPLAVRQTEGREETASIWQDQRLLGAIHILSLHTFSDFCWLFLCNH